MRHGKSGRQLGRNSLHRRALFRSLVTSLLEHERIETTAAKAKEIRIIADQIITLAKAGTLHARRQALAFVRKKDVVSKAFSDLALRFSERHGGYTRLIKTRRRIGDAAPMVVIELVSKSEKAKTTLSPEEGAEPQKKGSSSSLTQEPTASAAS